MLPCRSIFIGLSGLVSLLALLSAPAVAQPAQFVSYVVENHGKADRDLPATFGSVFVQGDVPRGQTVEAVANDGTVLATQLDGKAFYPDGSLRHGVVTVVIPHLESGEHMSISLRAKKPDATKPISLSELPAGFDAVVTLKMGNQVLSTSAKALLAAGHPETWLSGQNVSEWWVNGPFRDQSGKPDPHMYVQFGIRSYGENRPLRVEADVENDWTFVPGRKTEAYGVDIKANGKTIYSNPALVQSSQTRWRVGFWWNEPVSTYVRQNLPYMEKTHAIPTYDPALSVSYDALSKEFDEFASAPHGPMQAGIIEKYMPTTGGRPDIGPLPEWQAFYLLSMDPRAYQMTLVTADQGASFSSHYRNEKTRRPMTLEDYPKLSTHSNLVGHGPGQLQLPDTGGYKDPLTPDAAHEPSLDFVPYLVTGDRFYLEELQFWAEWNLTGSEPSYRNFADGLEKWDQIRAQAWSLRTLAQAEFITPNNDPAKAVFHRQLKANIDWYTATYVKNPAASPLHFILSPDSPYDNGRSMAPWQDDFFTWSIGYIQSLGDVDASALLKWKAVFPVQRMIAPGFCWILASSYTLRVRDSLNAPYYSNFAKVYEASLPTKLKNHAGDQHLPCASNELADAIGHKDAREMGDVAQSTDGYAAYMQPALAASVDAGNPGAEQAWQLFQSRSIKPDYSTGPEWDVVPRK